MGLIDSIKSFFGMGVKHTTIIILGLDNSGKTTIINKLKKENAALGVAPTVGYATDTLRVGNVEFNCYDMSGQEKYRHLWEKCIESVEGIIFVIDSDDRCRMCIVKDELDNLLMKEPIKSKKLPILFFSNKMDLPSAMTTVECSTQLKLETITDKPWNITSSNALTGEGLEDGINWLVDKLTHTK